MSTTRTSARRASSGTSPTSANSTPTRKVPRCTQCQRPRAGHPRQGCPYVSDINTSPSKDDNVLTQALNTLDLEDQEEKSKSILRARRASLTPKKVAFENEPSLESLTTITSSEFIGIRNSLIPSSSSSSGEETDTEDKVRKWQKQIHTPDQKPSFPHSGMPGTLLTPDASFNSTGSLKEEVSTACPQSLFSSRRLQRTMSVEERELFMQDLGQFAVTEPPRVYRFSPDLIELVVEEARRLRLYARVMPPVISSKGDSVVQVVMGRDEKAVQNLYESLNPRGSKPGNRSGLRAAAGGAVVGAVATFTGLAFS